MPSTNPTPDDSGRFIGHIDGSDVFQAPGLVSLGEKCPPSLEDAREVLSRVFKYEKFWVGQERTIAEVLKGNDVIDIRATSGGKSILYQVPAILLHERYQKVAIIISPLIALIRDQYLDLRGKDIKAAFFDSLQPDDEKKEMTNRVLSNEVALIYVSPERFTSEKFQKEIVEKIKISFLGIDEAHVVSKWGRGFRWCYGPKLSGVLENLEALNIRPNKLAVTATATSDVIADIVSILKLKQPYENYMEIDRPNLTYCGRRFYSNAERLLALGERLQQDPLFNGKENRKAVVYVVTRKDTELISEFLREKFGLKAVAYHGQMDPQVRLKNQEDFANGDANIMVATKAFGLGVNYKDVDLVMHVGVTSSLEDYIQEAGRAGRAGQPALCELWWQSEDFLTQVYFINSSNPTREKVLNDFKRLWSWIPPEQRNQELPSIYLDLNKYLPSEGVYSAFSTRKRAALTILMDSKAISIDGGQLKFKAQPGSENSHLPNIEMLLPSSQEFAQRIFRDNQALKFMAFYANNLVHDRYSPRRILMNHLRHNSLVDHVDPLDLTQLVPIDEIRLSRVIEIVANEDIDVSKLDSLMRRGKLGKTHLIGVTRDPIKGLSKSESKAIINYAVWGNFLRHYRKNSRNFVALADAGLNLLRERLSPDKQHLLDKSTTFETFSKRMGQSMEIPTFRAALNEWWTSVKDKIYNDRNLRLILLRSFAKTNFYILDHKISGRDLAAIFVGKKQEAVSAQDIRSLLNYIFPDFIDLISERMGSK